MEVTDRVKNLVKDPFTLNQPFSKHFIAQLLCVQYYECQSTKLGRAKKRNTEADHFLVSKLSKILAIGSEIKEFIIL